MNWLRRIFVKLAGSLPTGFILSSRYGASIIPAAEGLELYKAWVYGCSERRAKGIAAVEFILYRSSGGKVRRVESHPLLDLLYKPNPQTTKYDFLRLAQLYRDLLGASPIVVRRNGSGRPIQLWLARPEYLKEQRAQDGTILGYLYEVGTYKETFAPADVLNIRNPNPVDPNRGLSILEAVRLTAQNDDLIVQNNNSLLENGARSSGYFVTQGTVSDEEIARLEKKAQLRWGGVDNAFKLRVLQGGMEFKPDILPPRDLEFIEGRKLNRDEIMSIFGVPRPLMAIENTSLADAKTAEYVFAKWTLEPELRAVIEYLNEFLVPAFGTDLWLDFNPLAREDATQALAEKQASCNAWRTVNEVRASEGLMPLAGGDTLYLPLNLLPAMGTKAGDNAVDKRAAVGIKELRGRGVQDIDEKTAASIAHRIANRRLAAKQLADDATNAVAKAVDAALARNGISKKVLRLRKTRPSAREFYAARMRQEAALERAAAAELKGFFKKQEARFMEAAAQVVSKKDAAAHGIDRKYEVDAIIEVIRPAMYRAALAGAEQVSDWLGEDAVPDLPFIEAWLAKVVEKEGADITDTTIAAFTDAIKEGVAAGEGVGDIAKRVSDIFDFADATRSTLIARTETARAVTEAHRQAYQHYGFTEVKWLLADDPCDECIAKAGNAWSVDSITGEIPAHPNCVAGDTPVLLRGIKSATRMAYTGVLVTIKTTGGAETTVTPNHPILTQRGFIAAGSLNVGDKIAKIVDGNGLAVGVPNDENAPPSARKAFNSLAKTGGMAATKVPAAAEQFHGDGKFGQGDVDIVSADGFLLNDLEPEAFERDRKGVLGRACAPVKPLSGGRNLGAVLVALAAATDGLVGGEGIEPVLLGGAPCDDLADSLRSSPKYNTRGKEPVTDAGAVDAEGISDALRRLASHVVLDDIAAIDRAFVRGHKVYDFSTYSTVYLAGGVVVSNCKCDHTPVVDY